MVKEGEARASFQLRHIRRTCETMSAALRISKDVRSHLLSHGLGRVQNQLRPSHLLAGKHAGLKKMGRASDEVTNWQNG